MKLTALVFASLALAACSSSAPPPRSGPTPQAAPSGNVTGSRDASSAVMAFLTAAKSKDLQAMSAVWGCDRGSVRDGSCDIPSDQVEKRELIMFCYLDHDARQILVDAPSTNGERAVAVQLRHGALTGKSNFYAVRAADGRWYVRAFDMESLTDFCRNKR